MSIFQKIAAAKKTEIAALKKNSVSFARLQVSTKSLAAVLTSERLQIIAEIKRGSPGMKEAFEPPNLPKIIDAYNKSAAAISVVVESQFFNGQIEDIKFVADNSPKPILVKEVVLDKVQVDWLRYNGADAILLNANLLSKQQLKKLSDHIISYRMEPFVEVHDIREFYTALEIGAQIIAIHNVNPSTWETDNGATESILESVGIEYLKDKVLVYASGVKSLNDLSRVSKYTQFNAVLIGTAFMQNLDLVHRFNEELTNNI
ncbi:Tryptophan biosynthesis protein TrpCF [Legionella massiliensis]|uniref:indole-3-glycerol-phosphate synthase n=1 Tax=Legionella massiliensis TaxID=1034943 RepID=A0A078KWC6_9GAMM|nr:indole-3-glycerol phosphate synthase TrpC [Legionella massiliensis]CDZ77301.1 Tryptophan biosynthesis protein TrpCF [Legionella massiliensis]CEE13039.1 Indole-3-glycerol phosphate synthase [Legionella massiliensis]